VSDDEHDDDEMIPDEIVLPLEQHIDLHAFKPRDVRSVTEAYLEQALEAGLLEVRLIHGRGIGVQREIVRSLLSQHPGVAGFTDAPPGRGGWGATIVRLVAPTAIDAVDGVAENETEANDDEGKS
jgi:dsDNA-specific endonuclease/ATPase MutS2